MLRDFAILSAFAVCAFAQYVPVRELNENEKSAVEAAVPSKAAATPKKSRRILITNMARRDGKPIGTHPSSSFGNHAVIAMGKRTGAYEAVVDSTEEAFRAENLKQYDAIVFLNTNGVLTDQPVLRQALLDFVKNGKGLVGFHAAGATFVQYPVYDQFPEFSAMLGGAEDGGHPWSPKDTTYIKIDEPQHPLNAAFKGEPFEIQDEAFQFREPTLRDRLRVLISIDTSKMDTTRRLLKQRRADMDFPVSWVKPYGKGRVFYTTMGHNPKAFQTPMLLEHFLAGIQYALGDLEAADRPLPRPTPAKP